MPVGKKAQDEESLTGLAKYLPIAGIVIGAILTIIYVFLIAAGASSLLGAAILVTAMIVLTGGLHIDGLMDTADGICSHKDRDAMLEIMKDSRVGNFGAITGILNILLKTCALATLFAFPVKVISVLILVPCWARWAELYAIGSFEYARPFGSGKIWHDTTKKSDLLIGALIPLTVSVFLTTHEAFFVGILVPSAVLSGILAAHWLGKKLNGQTGDTYGAVVEFSETAALVCASCFALYC